MATSPPPCASSMTGCSLDSARQQFDTGDLAVAGIGQYVKRTVRALADITDTLVPVIEQHLAVADAFAIQH